MHGLQSAVFHVGVDLRGADAGVAKHFLECADVRASSQQMRGKTMSQCVGADIPATDSLRIPLNQRPDRFPINPAAAA